MVFCYKVLSFFIIHQDLSFGGFALKIEFVVFVYELINYLFMKLFFLLLGYIITYYYKSLNIIITKIKVITYDPAIKLIKRNSCSIFQP